MATVCPDEVSGRCRREFRSLGGGQKSSSEKQTCPTCLGLQPFGNVIPLWRCAILRLRPLFFFCWSSINTQCINITAKVSQQLTIPHLQEVCVYLVLSPGFYS